MILIDNNGYSNYTISLLDMEIARDACHATGEEFIFFHEYEGVYTAGRSFDPNDFKSPTLLDMYYISRGGQVTVHSAGQLVIYPIINLKNRGLNISQFVNILEQWMIDVLEDLGIRGNRSSLGRGVWVDDIKIGFIGVNISKGISSHGICFNVSNDLSYFDNIVPCGIPDCPITSVQKQLNATISIQEIKKLFKKHITNIALS